MPDQTTPPPGISAAVDQAARRAVDGHDRLSTRTIQMILEAVEPLIWDQAIRAHRDANEVAIARLRALHERYRTPWTDEYDICPHCTKDMDLVPFPCPTIQALNGEAPSGR